MFRSIAAPLLIGALSLGVATAGLADEATVDCELRFEMSGWSVLYKTASGVGKVTCNNGQSLDVKLTAKGGGLSFGKSSIENGFGDFSAVKDISEVLGAYASAEAHAGAVRSAKGQVVTKGEVSLALSGTGRGWDLGIAFGSFRIDRL